MKMTILPESFRYSFAGEALSNQISMQIQFDSDEELHRYQAAEKNVDLRHSVTWDEGQTASVFLNSSALSLQLQYKSKKKEFNTRDMIKKIASRFQQADLITKEQHAALEEATDSFRQTAFKEDDYFDKYEKFILTITCAEVTAELQGTRQKIKQGGWQGSEPVKLMNAVNYEKSEVRKSSFAPGGAAHFAPKTPVASVSSAEPVNHLVLGK